MKTKDVFFMLIPSMVFKFSLSMPNEKIDAKFFFKDLHWLLIVVNLVVFFSCKLPIKLKIF